MSPQSWKLSESTNKATFAKNWPVFIRNDKASVILMFGKYLCCKVGIHSNSIALD